MPLSSFSSASAEVGRLVVGADAGGEIAVEVEAGKQRRMAVDRPALESGELGEAGRIAGAARRGNS